MRRIYRQIGREGRRREKSKVGMGGGGKIKSSNAVRRGRC
jgi:hypothetical protein